MSDAQSKELCETSDGVMCSGKGEKAGFSTISAYSCFFSLQLLCKHTDKKRIKGTGRKLLCFTFTALLYYYDGGLLSD